MDEQLISDLGISVRKNKRIMIILISFIIILTILCSIFIMLYTFEKSKNKKKSNDNQSSPETNPLSLWNDCEAKKKLIDFIQTTTKKGSPDFIEKEDRIAVFDFDGTLFQETAPVYADYQLFKYRVLDDPEYSSKATEEQKSIAHEIEEVMKTGNHPKGLDLRHAKANAEIFKDMTIEEADIYTKNFVNRPVEGYNNLKKGDAFYKPMIEVVEYLRKNDFLVYIVSGSDRFTVRALADKHINVPKNQIIGSEGYIIASNQGEIDGFNYTFNNTLLDELIFEGKFIVKNLYMNKVYHIIREIGKKPVLSFGNSMGDSSMANYVISDKKKKSLAFMLLCDDLDRENGNEIKAETMKEQCQINNWIPVSMKNDWKTIYGNNVTRIK